MNAFELDVPTSLDQALDLLAEYREEAKLIAGGTGLLNLMKQRLAFPERLISLHRVPGLDGLTDSEDEINIGASTTLAALERHPAVIARLPMLCEALGEVASPRVRARATVGGAVAHGDPHQDTPVALLAYDARVTARSRQGIRTLPLETFYEDFYETCLEPDEIITSVSVSVPRDDVVSGYVKYLPRSHEDYATVAVAATIILDTWGQVETVRVALGSVAATPILAVSAGESLRGAALTSEAIRDAAELVRGVTDPISDARGSAEYKRDMAVVFTRRLLERLASSVTAAN